MCGIAGIVYRDRARFVCLEELKRMCGTMIHRGPDDEGFFQRGHVGLGMRRLKVIDLLTGHQPISNEDGSIWIVFNGEIYNYPELRRELERKGHRFSTSTDTETIVHAYEEYGERCVHRLNGMFAFGIWDSREDKLFLARDRIGVKPLYYFVDDRSLVFGSELKALLASGRVPRAIDATGLDAFLTLEYIPAPRSIFKAVKKLPPGHALTLRGGAVSVRQYWDLRHGKLNGDEDELAEVLYQLLKDAVRIRLVSDVPLGAFLSGGIDSSTLVCLMSELMDRPVKTFSIGFDDPSYNELEYARKVAKYFGTDHHELIIRPDVVDLASGLIRHLDEPLADVSIFPTYLVSKLASEHVTVVLSGDGGDELFAGYEWYIAQKIACAMGRLPEKIRKEWLVWLSARITPTPLKKGLVNKVKRFLEGAALPESFRHFRWSLAFTDEMKAALYSEDHGRVAMHSAPPFLDYLTAAGDADTLWQEQFADIKTYLPDDILAKVDRMSMAHSLEARTPYLDYRIAEFAAALPSRLRLNGFKTKYLLKRCMADRLPESILKRRKEGFSIPMKHWLRKELRPMMEDLLSRKRIREAGIFNDSYIEKLKADHFRGTANYSHQLWCLMVFEIWRDAYLSGTPSRATDRQSAGELGEGAAVADSGMSPR